MKLNKMGFTLIELLAVITILGILMIVGIPAVQRTINNSRKDTYVDTAQAYLNATKTAWFNDEITCSGGVKSTAVKTRVQYTIGFATGDVSNVSIRDDIKNNAQRLLQSGGKSSWGNNDVIGMIVVTVGPKDTMLMISMCDQKRHCIFGIDGQLDRSSVYEGNTNQNLNKTFEKRIEEEKKDNVICNIDD